MKVYLLYINRDNGYVSKLVKIFSTLEGALQLKSTLEEANEILDMQDIEIEVEEREVEE
jgi:hypothetical protein